METFFDQERFYLPVVARQHRRAAVRAVTPAPGVHLRFFSAFLGDDVDHAAQGEPSVKGGHGAFDDIDPVHHLRGQPGKVHQTVGVAGIGPVERDPVDVNGDLAAVVAEEPPHADPIADGPLRVGAQGKAGDVPQHVQVMVHLLRLDVLRRDDGNVGRKGFRLKGDVAFLHSGGRDRDVVPRDDVFGAYGRGNQDRYRRHATHPSFH